MAQVAALVSKRLRLEPEPLLIGLAVTAVAIGCGLVVGQSIAETTAEDLLGRSHALFVVIVALTAGLPLSAVGALYHDALHQSLLPLPVSGRQHAVLSLRLFVRGKLRWLLLAIFVAVGSSGPRLWLPAIFAAAIYCGGFLYALGFAGLASAVSASRSPAVVALRKGLAGPFSSEHHAPFFYLPALAFLFTATSATLAEAGLALTFSSGVGLTSLALIAMPICGGLAVAGLGMIAYQRHCLRVIPRVAEEAKSVYAGNPVPADPPYGHMLSTLLPAAIRPHFAKELRELVRANRAYWALLTLAILICLGYAVNAGAPSRAAPLVALLLVVWAGTRALRPGPAARGGAMLVTLPTPGLADWSGRTVALLFVSGHLGCGCALAIAYRHGAAPATVILLTLTAAVSLTAALTQIRRRDQQRLRWGSHAQFASVLSLVGGLVGLRWPQIGVTSLATFTAVGAMLGGRHR